MTIAQYEGISAITLGLPESTAIPEARSTLPIQLFTTKPPISSRLRQHFTNRVDAITMISLLRPETTGLADGTRYHEILIMAIGLKTEEVPLDVLEHIALLRSSGIIFVCIYPSGGEATGTLALRRPLPNRPGHRQEYQMHLSETKPADQIRLSIQGETINDLWESLCAQVILGRTESQNLDQEIARRDRIKSLKGQEAKLSADHSRARSTQDRNTIYAKLHKIRVELEELQDEHGDGK